MLAKWGFAVNWDVMRRKNMTVGNIWSYPKMEFTHIYTPIHGNLFRRNTLFEFAINPGLQLWDAAGQNADSHGMEPTHFMKNGTGVPTVTVDWYPLLVAPLLHSAW